MEIYLSKAEMTQAEYFEALKQKPSGVKILCRKMTEPPDEYDSDIWGPWPKDGMMVSLESLDTKLTSLKLLS